MTKYFYNKEETPGHLWRIDGHENCMFYANVNKEWFPSICNIYMFRETEEITEEEAKKLFPDAFLL